MTHNEWETGKSLTIHNATKEQLKFMVQDRDQTIKNLYKELEDSRKAFNELLQMVKQMEIK